jgi:hypothetical protein
MIAPAPEWLLRELRADRPASGEPAVPEGEVIPDGRRHTVLCSWAGKMREAGLSGAAIAAALAVENEARFAPPVPPRDVEDIGRNYGAYPAGSVPGVTLRHGGGSNGEAPPDPLTLEDATAADLIRVNATIRWVWEGWLPVGVLTILASEPGVGKTRFCADLLRRAWHGLPWPDGTPATLPAGSRALWVAADNQHPELGSLPGAFGFPPEALYLNASRANPFAGTTLDAAEELDDFEKRLARVRPALVFVDTCLNATDRSAHKPEDAKAFFKPLMEIAQRCQLALVCVTHLNAAGKPLGRRIQGQGRVVTQMSQPDPEGQPHRRKLWVTKSHSVFPRPLGVTMGAAGNEYDLNPPAAPEDAPPTVNAAGSRLAECAGWLDARLRLGPQKVMDTIHAAEQSGFARGLLYRAFGKVGAQEYSQAGRKWWRYTPPEEVPPDRGAD